jgi:hypothetical protein
MFIFRRLFASTIQPSLKLPLNFQDAIFFETAKDYFLETFREYKATKNERFSPSQYGIYKQQLQKLAGLEELQYKCYKEKAQTALNVFEVRTISKVLSYCVLWKLADLIF